MHSQHYLQIKITFHLLFSVHSYFFSPFYLEVVSCKYFNWHFPVLEMRNISLAKFHLVKFVTKFVNLSYVVFQVVPTVYTDVRGHTIQSNQVE